MGASEREGGTEGKRDKRGETERVGGGQRETGTHGDSRRNTVRNGEKKGGGRDGQGGRGTERGRGREEEGGGREGEGEKGKRETETRRRTDRRTDRKAGRKGGRNKEMGCPLTRVAPGNLGEALSVVRQTSTLNTVGQSGKGDAGGAPCSGVSWVRRYDTSLLAQQVKNEKGRVQLRKKWAGSHGGGNRTLGGVVVGGEGRPSYVPQSGIPTGPHDGMGTGDNVDMCWRFGGIHLGKFV